MDSIPSLVYIIRDNNGHIYLATFDPEKAKEIKGQVQENLEYAGSTAIASITETNVI